MVATAKAVRIERFLRGSSLGAALPKRRLVVPGLALEKHRVSPGALPEIEIDSFVLMLWQGSSPALGEYMGPRRKFVRYKKQAGTLTLYHPGLVPEVRAKTKSSFLVGALDETFMSQVRAEIRDDYIGRGLVADGLLSRNKPEFFDAPLMQLLGLLQAEAQSGGASGKLYAEHLVYALASRIASLSGLPECERFDGRGSQDRIAMKRVLERIEADTACDFDVATLAEEAGQSPSRFFRTFRAATGYTPHQYLVNQRLARVTAMLQKPDLSIAQIALETGFANHAHLCRAFRQKYGVSPSEYKQNI